MKRLRNEKTGESFDSAETSAVAVIRERLESGETVTFDEIADALFSGDRVPATD
ncbi:hypothetical protein FACS1894170_13440 [Planctomycetales bacterium]|nr:hypothetical protein FACS1894170_13440 [Planctomycetales bacterium]